MDLTTLSAEEVVQASERIAPWVHRTPMMTSRSLDERIGAQVFVKCEQFQRVGAFKFRGACNAIASLSSEERARGVVTHSSGNHAQALALAASLHAIPAYIVMPSNAPQVKRNAVMGYGAEVITCQSNLESRETTAEQVVQDTGARFIHPYDDPMIIAGQGTVALELIEQMTPQDYVFIPCGGGGLLAGMAVLLKHHWPDTKVIGVEPSDAACALAARQAGSRVTLSEVGLFADGCAVARVGEETHRLIEQHVDDIITATTDEMCAAVKDIFEDTRAIAEPAGALAIAGMKKYVAERQLRDSSLLAVVSGANTNFDRLRYISERTDIGERREAIFSVAIPERRGAFRDFCRVVGKRNITEFNYRYSSDEGANIFVGVSVAPGTTDNMALVGQFESAGYVTTDLTDDETAKLHVRYMIGGRSPSATGHERLFRVEFPERPGALMKFLDALGSEFDISLFHYRNHGAAYGRILVGFTVSDNDEELIARLNDLGYPYEEETNNRAYLAYLK